MGKGGQEEEEDLLKTKQRQQQEQDVFLTKKHVHVGPSDEACNAPSRRFSRNPNLPESAIVGMARSFMVAHIVHLNTLSSLGHRINEPHVMQLPVAKSLLPVGCLLCLGFATLGPAMVPASRWLWLLLPFGPFVSV